MEYILITPARNEKTFIKGTIQSVINQTILPKKWVIVSDGSTDGTDEIVKDFAQHHSWITLVRMPERKSRNFAAKVHCFNAGYGMVQNLPHNIVGNLDADITFEPDYFQFLLAKFAEYPRLGVAGTPFVEKEFRSYDHVHTNFDHVSGACQLFRRECFQEIGGYVPNHEGGIDWIAVATSRMKGWQTRTFPEKSCFHHRKLGSATGGAMLTRFKQGEKDYYLGGHPLWQIIRSGFQVRSRPYLIGGGALFAGYAWSALTRKRRPVSRELMRFHRKEQLSRLKKILGKILRHNKQQFEPDKIKDVT